MSDNAKPVPFVDGLLKVSAGDGAVDSFNTAVSVPFTALLPTAISTSSSTEVVGEDTQTTGPSNVRVP